MMTNDISNKPISWKRPHPLGAMYRDMKRRAETAEATIKRLDDLGGELAAPSVWLRGGHSIEVIIHEYFRHEAELATLREQLAAHEWRHVSEPPDEGDGGGG